MTICCFSSRSACAGRGSTSRPSGQISITSAKRNKGSSGSGSRGRDSESIEPQPRTPPAPKEALVSAGTEMENGFGRTHQSPPAATGTESLPLLRRGGHARLGGAGRHCRQPDQHRTSPRRLRQPLSAPAVPASPSALSLRPPSFPQLILSFFRFAKIVILRRKVASPELPSQRAVPSLGAGDEDGNTFYEDAAVVYLPNDNPEKAQPSRRSHTSVS